MDPGENIGLGAWSCADLNLRIYRQRTYTWDGVKIGKDCMKPIKECAKVNKDSSKLSDVFVVIKETKKDKDLLRLCNASSNVSKDCSLA